MEAAGHCTPQKQGVTLRDPGAGEATPAMGACQVDILEPAESV